MVVRKILQPLDRVNFFLLTLNDCKKTSLDPEGKKTLERYFRQFLLWSASFFLTKMVNLSDDRCTELSKMHKKVEPRYTLLYRTDTSGSFFFNCFSLAHKISSFCWCTHTSFLHEGWQQSECLWVTLFWVTTSYCEWLNMSREKEKEIRGKGNQSFKMFGWLLWTKRKVWRVDKLSYQWIRAISGIL